MKNYLITLIILILVSCQKDVDIDIPFDKPQLVVNTHWQVDSVAKVSLTYNKSIVQNNSNVYNDVTDAYVELQKNNGSWIPLTAYTEAGRLFYKNNQFIFQANQQYNIRVTKNNYTQVSATDYIPSKIPINQLNVNYIGITNGNLKYDLAVHFTDENSTSNYYEITAYISNPNYKQYVDLTPKNPSYQTDYNEGRHIWITDELINTNAQINLTLECPQTSSPQTLVVELRNVTKNYFLYKTTLQLQQYYDGNPFVEPVFVFSNIQNGLGIAMGSNLSQKTIQL